LGQLKSVPGPTANSRVYAARARPTIGKKNSAADEAVALLQPKGTGTATANVVVQHSARHNHSPNNKLGGRYAAARTPTKDDDLV